MNTAVEFHDSRVADVTTEAQELRVAFRPAYVHESDGVPGTDPGWGYLQSVEFIFSEATVSEDGECRGPVTDGTVRTSTAEYANLVPLPLSASGNITAELVFTTGGVLKVSACAFSCSAKGERDTNFRERYEG